MAYIPIPNETWVNVSAYITVGADKNYVIQNVGGCGNISVWVGGAPPAQPRDAAIVYPGRMLSVHVGEPATTIWLRTNVFLGSAAIVTPYVNMGGGGGGDNPQTETQLWYIFYTADSTNVTPENGWYINIPNELGVTGTLTLEAAALEDGNFFIVQNENDDPSSEWTLEIAGAEFMLTETTTTSSITLQSTEQIRIIKISDTLYKFIHY